MKKRIIHPLTILMLLVFVTPTMAYVHGTFDIDGSIKQVYWRQSEQPVEWYTYVNGSNDVSFSDMYRTLNNSFSSWENITSRTLKFKYAGNTTDPSVGYDGYNVIIFDESGSILGQGSSTLATTQFWISVSTGRLLDADIIFNGKNFNFAINGNNYDLESVATHEIGHLFGLDHANIGYEVDTSIRPTMSPYYFGLSAKTLEQDDKAGICSIYPAQDYFANTGNITGNFKYNGNEKFGAQVVALNATNYQPVEGVFTGYATGKNVAGQGNYQILGLEPGNYILKVTKMDGSNGIDPTNFNGIFTSTFDTDFKTMYSSNVFNLSQATNITITPNSQTTLSFVGNVYGFNASAPITESNITSNMNVTFSIIITNSGNDKDNFTFNLEVPSNTNAVLNETRINNLGETQAKTILLIANTNSETDKNIAINVSSTGNSSIIKSLNFTLLGQNQRPTIYSIELNDTYVNNDSILVNINASDASGIVNITINGSQMTLSNGFYSATINADMTEGTHNLIIIATDNSSLTIVNTTTYFVDKTLPAIIPFPLNHIINEPTSAITLTWEIIENNISSSRIVIDNSNVSFTTINKTIGTQNVSVTIDGLLSGKHDIYFEAIDNASNKYNITYEFYLWKQENVNDLANKLLSNPTIQQVNYRSANGSLLTGSISLNQTITKDFVINHSGIEISINITAHGQNFEETKANLFNIILNRSSLSALNIGSHLGGNAPSNLVFFQNMSQYLPEYSYALANGTKTFVTINFRMTLGRLVPFYIAEDIGNDVRTLQQCYNNTVPVAQASLSTMCYTNSSDIVILYLPHLSGGGLDDPSNAPEITLINPQTTISNSYFTANGNILDLNLDTNSCRYNFTNSTSTIVAPTSFSPTAVTTTNYTFAIEDMGFADLINGTLYNLTLSCSSTDGNKTTIVQQFTVKDTTAPLTKTITYAGTTSTTTSGTVTVTYTTEEIATCGYNSSSPTTLLTSFSSTTNNLTTTTGKSHTYTKDYSTDATITIPSVICIDRYSNRQSKGNESFTLSVDITEPRTVGSSRGGSGGGGGGSGKASPRKNSPVKITKTATKIVENQIITMSMINTEISLNRLVFTATEAIPYFNLTVIGLTDPPTGVTEINGQSYQYLNIKTYPEGKYKDIIFELRLAKEWLKENEIDEKLISLFVYENNKWQKLPTSLKGSSTVEASYSANVPHLSVFAVGKDNAAEENKAIENELTSEQKETNQESTETKLAQQENNIIPANETSKDEKNNIIVEQQKQMFSIWTYLGIALIIAIVLFFGWRKYQKDLEEY